jgi:hypothetical protein
LKNRANKKIEKILIPLSIDIDKGIEYHPFTRKDFDNSPFALEEIKRKGILIYE